MKLMTPIAEEGIVKVHNAGGIVAIGSDQASGPAVHREMELLQASGIKAADIVRIATLNSARHLGMEDTIGSIEVGKIADLLLLSADPSVDIDNAKRIVMVMKAGEMIDESKLPLGGGPQKRRWAF
jgi:imidazolonepropionase-like amidohydrolase